MHQEVEPLGRLLQLAMVVDIKRLQLDEYSSQLKNHIFVDFIYTSSVTDRESMNLKRSDIQDIVQKGANSKLLKNNPQKEILQAYGQKYALEQIEKWADLKKPITVDNLLVLHHMVFAAIDYKAGKFRSHYVQLRNSALMPSFPFAIHADMQDFNVWLIQAQKELKSDTQAIIKIVAKVYHEITRIHPFSDGNGRTARLFINLILRKYRLPHICIPKVDNDPHMRIALRQADMGELTLLEQFIAKLLRQSQMMVSGYGREKGFGK